MKEIQFNDFEQRKRFEALQRRIDLESDIDSLIKIDIEVHTNDELTSEQRSSLILRSNENKIRILEKASKQLNKEIPPFYFNSLGPESPQSPHAYLNSLYEELQRANTLRQIITVSAKFEAFVTTQDSSLVGFADNFRRSLKLKSYEIMIDKIKQQSKDISDNLEEPAGTVALNIEEIQSELSESMPIQTTPAPIISDDISQEFLDISDDIKNVEDVADFLLLNLYINDLENKDEDIISKEEIKQLSESLHARTLSHMKQLISNAPNAFELGHVSSDIDDLKEAFENGNELLNKDELETLTKALHKKAVDQLIEEIRKLKNGDIRGDVNAINIHINSLVEDGIISELEAKKFQSKLHTKTFKQIEKHIGSMGQNTMGRVQAEIDYMRDNNYLKGYEIDKLNTKMQDKASQLTEQSKLSGRTSWYTVAKAANSVKSKALPFVGRAWKAVSTATTEKFKSIKSALQTFKKGKEESKDVEMQPLKRTQTPKM